MIFFVCKRKWKALLFSVLFLCIFSLITTSLYGIYRPVFHSHQQAIDLKQILQQVPSAKIYHQNKEVGTNFSLFRSWNNQELIIKQEGFKDYFITLPTKWTEDSWAYSNGAGVPPGSPHSIRANELLTPIHTLFAGAFPPIGILFIPLGLFLDIGNLVSFPVLPIVNPWKEYDIAPLKKQIILEPTEELKKNCNKDGYFISNIGCTSCLYEGPVVASKNELERCQNRFYDKENKFSYLCDERAAIVTNEQNCLKCPNRKLSGRYCILAECSPDKPLRDNRGNCYSCDEKTAIPYIETAECDKCSNRHMLYGSCMKKCPNNQILQDYDGNCYSCDEDTSIANIDDKECNKCSNRYMYYRMCTKRCPTDKPLWDYKGNCYSCDVDMSVSTSETHCNQCPNRHILFKNSGTCVKICPDDKPLQDFYGKCYSCDDEQIISTTTTICTSCPNRENIGNHHCAIRCPMESLRDEAGQCHHCEEEQHFLVRNEAECQKCPNRKYDEHTFVCKLTTTCPKERPLRDAIGKCHSCDEKQSINIGGITREKICNEVCPNRELYGELMEAV